MARTYEANRDLLASVENKWPTSTSVSKYAYVNDTVGRRTSCVYTGSAFSGGSGDHNDAWGYDDRNKLTGVTRRTGATAGSGTVVSADGRSYTYDPIGNRSNSTEGTSATVYDCANNREGRGANNLNPLAFRKNIRTRSLTVAARF